jgi:hypothetical protein
MNILFPNNLALGRVVRKYPTNLPQPYQLLPPFTPVPFVESDYVVLTVSGACYNGSSSFRSESLHAKCFLHFAVDNTCDIMLEKSASATYAEPLFVFCPMFYITK